MRVAFLGTGAMGAPMAANLARAGFAVRAWNRTAARAEPLATAGVRVAGSPEEAVAESDAIITMLADDAAVLELAPRVLRPGTVWVQMSTVGADTVERCASLAARAGVRLVDAPVLGTVGPARDGTLLVLAGGDRDTVTRLSPLFSALASRVVHAGDVGSATRLKLVLNMWSLSTVTVMAEAIALCEAAGTAPERFLECIAGGASDSAYARAKAELMRTRDYAPSARLALTAKDTALARDMGAGCGLTLPVVSAVAELMRQGVAAGHGDEDVAAVVEPLRAQLRGSPA